MCFWDGQRPSDHQTQELRSGKCSDAKVLEAPTSRKITRQMINGGHFYSKTLSNQYGKWQQVLEKDISMFHRGKRDHSLKNGRNGHLIGSHQKKEK